MKKEYAMTWGYMYDRGLIVGKDPVEPDGSGDWTLVFSNLEFDPEGSIMYWTWEREV